MPFSYRPKKRAEPPKQIFIYFNSWGGSFNQSLYLSSPLTKIASHFYVFTVGLSNLGGFNPNVIPEGCSITSDNFKTMVVDETERLLTQVINFINRIIDTTDQQIVLMSHSFGYTMLFASLERSHLKDHVSRIKNIIILDPAGKATNEKDRLVNTQLYGTFVKKFAAYTTGRQTDPNVYNQWRQMIERSTLSQFTTSEMLTGMYQYIKDCDNNSQLDLAVYAYGVEYWVINPIIKKYTRLINNKIYLLTTTHGLAYQNMDFWKSLGIVNIEIVSNAGHFLHIFSQPETIDSILNILQVTKYPYITYDTSYNAPLSDLAVTDISLN